MIWRLPSFVVSLHSSGTFPVRTRLGEAVKELVAELARVQFSRRILKSGDFSYQKVHSLGESGYELHRRSLSLYRSSVRRVIVLSHHE